MTQIIRLYLKTSKELTKHLLFTAGLMVFLPKLFIKQCTRPMCIGVFIAGTFYLNCSMSDIHAAPEMQEFEKVLDVDDSEVIPAIEEKIKEDLEVSEEMSLSEKTGEPMASVSAEGHSLSKEVIYHFNLGVYHQKQGNTIKAIEEYENVLRLDADNAEAHNNLGVIYKEQDDLDKAVEHYQFVVTSNPGMDEAHNNLGVIHYLRGNQREAVLEYQKALELNPNNLMSHINLGLVYKAQGLERKAIDILEEVLSERPFHPEAHYNLAILYEELGHLERAIWHYSRFIDNAGKSYLALTRNVTEHIKDLKVTSGEILGE